MLGGEFLGLGLAFVAARADEHDFCAHGTSCLALVFRRIARHDHHCLHTQGAGCIGNALSMVPARVGNDASLRFLLRQRNNFVVGAAQFEGANRLEIFGFQVEASVIAHAIEFMNARFDQRSAHSYAPQPGLGFLDVS